MRPRYFFDTLYKLFTSKIKAKEKAGEYFYFPDHYAEFTDKLSVKNFTKLGAGDFRTVWLRNNIVVKIPTSLDGLIDNLIEAKAWNKYKNKKAKFGIYLAPCRILSNGALIMARVNFDFKYDDAPTWARLIDQEQVGLYKKRFVCYDYALDVADRLTWEKSWGIKKSWFQTSYIERRPHLVTGRLPRKGKVIDTFSGVVRE